MATAACLGVLMFDPIASRFFDVGSQTRRISFQDDGREPPSLNRYTARLGVRDAEIFTARRNYAPLTGGGPLAICRTEFPLTQPHST
jgi:hypothetical protein